MDSINTDLALTQEKRELIRFQHPGEWQERPAFRVALEVTERNLSHFVGGYNLPKELYQKCGLIHEGKLCDQVHGHGFVVATTAGLETQIGKDCGLNQLGARFEELERLFTATIKDENLRERMLELTTQRSELLLQARRAVAECDKASAHVRELTHLISREKTLSVVFDRASKSEGNVYVEVRASNDEYELTRQRFRRESFGRIDGISAITARSPAGDIRAKVIPLFQSLDAGSLEKLLSRQLADKSKEVADAKQRLADAAEFVALCNRFIASQNWQVFARAFEPGKGSTNERGRRFLRQLSGRT